MDYTILNNTTAEWLVALVTALAVAVGLDALKSILVRRLTILAARTETKLDDIAVAALRSTKFLVLVLVGVYAGASLLNLPERVQLFVGRAAIVAMLVQVAIWGDHALRTWLAATRAQSSVDPDRITSSAAITFLVRVALWAIVALMVLDNLGVNITTLVASLGIGGIAIALAVQSILGDLFASLSIVLDKPFVVGDFIIVDKMLGTVEKIGLKTTRVRSLGGEQIVFSNNDLLKSRIQNLRRMESRRIVFSFGVSHLTPAPTLRELPEMVKEIVAAQPQVRFDRAHLNGIAAPTFNFEVVYYVDNTDYTVYMNVQQEIYLSIIAGLEARGVALALPVQTVRLAREQQAPGRAAAWTGTDARAA
ncbi:mechanosensitive ion channel family protein [Massilia sp. YIM B02443]|uniref:mechanosensitive ion channel family protein n=1 Tax=Massilia sp. YIM B02443 TaxID=3050127 RepID=UPI0025B6D515|nr:mechanosensitive ion channel family protein [Massilia sp. YIM B02443]MDN4039858.1 mechanosensitive ion channel family protein [Massilia sp. YIM B02443]